ncbi:hypothetical protein HBN50_13035 [Halobacteriovorax sp. GB3]|uniref:hypothetical protein n=1 Tax=Halobacteriovorax sp. GB3 TaxID=2719615 RepID=UPI002361DF19|nr:hypothetical protein [Halobacteriovorax sp. GB3]MDD0854030.1 hypothetical protein [Halobacteriovorax sp. GB3]
MKKLVYLLSALSLFHLQLTFSVDSLKVEAIRSAYAQESSNTTNSEEPQARTKTKDAQLSEVDTDSENFLNLITMMAIGYIVSRQIILCKPNPTDTLVAAAAGIAYVAGEIYSTTQYKKLKDEQLKYVISDDGSTNEKQVELLQQQKKGYQDVIKTAQTKKTIQMAATAGLGIASAMAAFSGIQDITATAGCAHCGPGTAAVAIKKGAIVKAPVSSTAKKAKLIAISVAMNSTCAAEATASMGTTSAAVVACTTEKAFEAYFNTACAPTTAYSNPNSLEEKYIASLFKSESFIEEIKDEFMAIQNSKESVNIDRFGIPKLIDKNFPAVKKFEGNIISRNDYFAYRDQLRFNNGELKTSSLKDYENFNKNLNYVSTKEEQGLLSYAVEKGFDLVFPKAHAGAFGLIGAAAAVFMGVTMTQGQALDLWLAHPEGRAISYAGMAVLSLLASKTTDKIIKTSEDNIEKIDKIIERMNRYATGDNDPGKYERLANGKFVKLAKGRKINITNGSDKLSCIAEGSEAGKCASVEKMLEKSKYLSQFPAGLTSAGALSTKVADSLQGSSSLSGASLDAVNELAGKNGAIKNLNNKIRKKLAEAQKKAGIDDRDFNTLTDKFTNDMRNAVSRALKRNGQTPSSFLASAGISAPVSGDDAAKKALADKKLQEELKKNLAKRTGATKLGTGKGSGGFSLDLEEDDKEKQIAMNAKKVAELNENREVKEDIIKDKGVSLFKVISVRYLKSGYPRLLEEVEEK